MARAVVILGAGSSADFGVPTLAGMFNDKYARKYLQRKPELEKMLNQMFWQPRGHNLASSDQCVNIEQMLTIIRDWQKENAVPPELKPKNIQAFRRSLYVLIQQAVFEDKTTRGKHLNPLIDICGKTFKHTTWASFNWDCIFESSFWYSQENYGPGSRSNPSLAIEIANWRGGTSKHTYLKLHGGINWWLIDDCVTYLQWTGHGELQIKWSEYDKNPTLKDRPVILEPSFYKYDAIEYKQLAPQWQKFTQELLAAECVVIIGYSLPEMDINARASILTAFQVNNACKWLVVNPSESACNLYKKLLGHNRTTILQTTLAEFNNDIKSKLEKAFPDITFIT